MSSAVCKQLLDLCRDVLGPLLKADGGELYIVTLDDDALVVHLAGRCSGCPGGPTTSKSIIEPAVHLISPSIRVAVSFGARIPDGAVSIDQYSLKE